MSAPTALHPERLHVGDIATGTAFARRGPVIRIEDFGPCGAGCRCLTFADRVEITIHDGDLWPIGGTP